MTKEIDARGIYYKDLNERIRALVAEGEKSFLLRNVNGQRYIGDGVKDKGVVIEIEGTPGNDLATFMDGPTIIVRGNAQDGICNTMNEGRVEVHGQAGDVLGYAMRGGRLLVHGDVGYRVGIHMKSYKEKIPSIIIGGTAGDFLCEYMAGGTVLLLGVNNENGYPLCGGYLGTGMHGGVLYVRGDVADVVMGKEIARKTMDEADAAVLAELVGDFASTFGHDPKEILAAGFTKFVPMSKRPYGKLYAY